MGRFVNADDTNVLEMQLNSMFKDNLYCYCNSNPVNNYDPSGRIAANVIGAVVGGVLGAVGGGVLGKWLADKLNIKGAIKRKIFIGAVSLLVGASAAAIGYFIGQYIAKAWSYWRTTFMEKKLLL